MSDFNTGNPVPSTDPRDLDDNATVFDNLVNGLSPSYQDRLGMQRKSYAQMEADAAALFSDNVTALAGLSGVADRGFYFTGAGAMALYTLSSLGRTLASMADAAAARATLSAAKSGANDDILSLSGLTTALSVSQGGTGVTSSTGSGANALATSPTLTAPNIVGTATNDNAPAGSVGELISSTVLNAAAVSLTTATVANVTSIVLTPGDWDVWGTVATKPAGSTTTSSVSGAISLVSAVYPAVPGDGAIAAYPYAMPAGQNISFPVGQRRISVAVDTTIYLCAAASFSVSTNGAYGFIGARRVR